VGQEMNQCLAKNHFLGQEINEEIKQTKIFYGGSRNK
jgi:hypothetical protein